MGNSPGIYIDPNGERFTPYADEYGSDYLMGQQDEATGYYAGVTASLSGNRNPLFGMNTNNTLMATGQGGNAIAALGRGVMKLFSKLGRLFDRADNSSRSSGNNSTVGGYDYYYDGELVSYGGSNGLGYNRIVKVNNKGVPLKGKRNTLNIGNVDIVLNKAGAGNSSGQYFEISQNPKAARTIYLFLMVNSSNEWSYTEYGLDNDGGVHSRISTSREIYRESIGGALANERELAPHNVGKLVYWISIHSHSYQSETGSSLSTEDGNALRKHSSIYPNAKMHAIFPNQTTEFYQYLPTLPRDKTKRKK